MNSRSCPILLLGLGNDLLGDDAAGLLAVRGLKEEFAGKVDVVETIESGLVFMDIMAGYGRVLLLDSIMTGKCPPGTILEFSQRDFSKLVAPSLHNAGLPEVFHLAARLGIDFPAIIRILALEIENPFNFGAQLTPAVKKALPGFVAKARGVLRELLGEGQ